MTEQIMASRIHPIDDCRIALKSDGTGRDRHRYAAPVEKPHQSPDAGTAAIFRMRFGSAAASKKDGASW